MSKFKILGHPIHPMLIPLPIGFIVATLTANVAYLATDKDMTWYDAATWAGAAALVTGAVAALPGLGDYLTMGMSARARLVATLHFAANAAMLVVFAVAFVMMLDDGATAGSSFAAVFALHLIGGGLVTLSGYLGGELVYKHGLAVESIDATAHGEVIEARGQSGSAQYRKERPIV